MYKSLLLAVLAGTVSFSALATEQMTVYKSQYCGCCKTWIKHMEENGFAVKVVETEQLERLCGGGTCARRRRAEAAQGKTGDPRPDHSGHAPECAGHGYSGSALPGAEHQRGGRDQGLVELSRLTNTGHEPAPLHHVRHT